MPTNSRTYRVLAGGLAAWLFVCSLGIFVDFHYCQGDLKSVGVMTNAVSCAMDVEAPTSKGINELTATPCCDNKSIHALLDCDTYYDNQYDLIQDSFTTTFLESITDGVETFTLSELATYCNPPPIEKGDNLQVLYQIFLI